MRELTSTLLAAQRQTSGIPYVKVEATNRIAGVVRLDWQRLYEGSEGDYFHSLTMPGDGSLIRVRIGPPGDNGRLYRQRVENPDGESDFSSWTYTGQDDCIAVAAASCGAEVFIFWVDTSRELMYIRSTDYGISWGTPQLLDYSITTSVNGLAAAFKPNGDMALFIADQDTLYVKKRIGGSWESKTAWDRNTGDLSGVAAVYDADWNLVVSGEDTGGNYKLWSLIYGDGGDIQAGTWSDLKELNSAPSDGDFQYRGVFLDKPDVYRCFYVESYTGSEAYDRPFWSHSVTGSDYTDSLWHEPVPFDRQCEYGMAIAHYGDCCWLTTPDGVWRAELDEKRIELSQDIVSIRQETGPRTGKLTVELRNDTGGYNPPPFPLETGCRIEVSPGYVTEQGSEVSSGPSYILESCEYVSEGGKSNLNLYGLDGWRRIETWRSGCQFRWNRTGDEMSVMQIIRFVLGRTGIKLTVVSQSSVITGFYPDFTIHAGSRGINLIEQLLSFVPDTLFIEGDEAFLVNPLPTDDSVYSYGQTHPVLSGRYLTGVWKTNRVQVEGYDAGQDEKILKDSFEWGQVNKLNDRFLRLGDGNIDTVTGAAGRGEAVLREAGMDAESGSIRIPVNCGQQLYDVIDITDERAGLDAEKKRVTGIILVYNPERGEYIQTLSLASP